MRSQAAVIAPVRRPICPAGTDGSQCRANAREAPSSTPEATTSVAPPGTVSSAGWKTQPHRAGQPVERGQRHGDAEDDGGVHVVPAGVAEALAGGGVGHVLEVGQRQGVDVGAQDDDRVAGPDLADQAGAGGQPARLEPVVAQPLLQEGGRLELGEGQLRVGVQVPAGGR